MQTKNILLSIFLSVIILLLNGCTDQQPTSIIGFGQLIIEVTFESEYETANSKKDKLSEFGSKLESFTNRDFLKRISKCNRNSDKTSNVGTIGLFKSTIKITDLIVQLLEADGSEILEDSLKQQADGTFQGVINVPSGNDRIIKLKALFNGDEIAKGDTSNVDIFPGRSTRIAITLSVLAGIERHLVAPDTLGGFAGNVLPVTATVTDVNDAGVSGIQVLFKVVTADAIFENQSQEFMGETDLTGSVSAILFLGNTPGIIEVQVEANDRTGDPLLGSPQTTIVIAESLEIIKNGSFEKFAIADPPPFTTVGDGSKAIECWVVTGEIDYINGLWFASDGDRNIDLNGSDARGAIYQALTTKIGAQYEVLFDMAGNPDNRDSSQINKKMLVSASGQSQVFDFDIAGTTRDSMGWQLKTFFFIATDTTTTLAFASLIPDSWGPALDNVRVSEIRGEDRRKLIEKELEKVENSE